MTKSNLEKLDEARQRQNKVESELEILAERLAGLGREITQLQILIYKYPPPDLSSIINRLGDVQRFSELMKVAADAQRTRFEIYAGLSDSEKSILGSAERDAFLRFSGGKK